jgi:hypothetical protein
MVGTRNAPAGYSGTPLAKKLGIKPGLSIVLRGAPAHFHALLEPLPADITFATRVTSTTDMIHAFVSRKSLLELELRKALKSMRSDAVLWVSWPKKASGVATDITEDTIRAVALPLGLVDVKVCAVDETWSGLKLVVRKSLRQ